MAHRTTPDALELLAISCWLDEEDVRGVRRKWWRRALSIVDSSWRAAWHRENEFE